MKGAEKHLRVFVLIVLFLGACTSGADNGDTAAATPTAETIETADSVDETPTDVPAETPSPEPDPTATPVPEPPSDDELIAAAAAGLETDGAAGLAAFDVLGSELRGDGLVSFELCGWTGETVYSQVYESLWTPTGATGDVTATELSTALTQGECTNTAKIESAFEFIREYDAFVRDYDLEPSIYFEDPRVDILISAETQSRARPLLQSRVADQLSVVSAAHFSTLPQSATRPLLQLSFRDQESGIDFFGLTACEQIDQDFGLYGPDGALLDDLRTDSDPGEDTATAYLLLRSPETEFGWQLGGIFSRVWIDCTNDTDWVADVADWTAAQGWLEL